MKKKLLLSVGLAALTAGVLVGCGQNDGKVHISFWHTMGQTNQAWLNERITEFNAMYPDVVIEHTAQGGYDDLKGKISKAIPAGTTPTMAYCYPDHVADYLVAGAVEELTPYIDDATIGLGKKEEDKDLGDLGKDDFITAYWNEGNAYVNGDGTAAPGVYSLPFSKSTEVMFYNKTAFDENNWTVPTSWNELWAWAKKAKEKYPGVIPVGYDSDANFLITLFEQYQIPYTSATTTPDKGHFLFNNKRAKDLVRDLADYYAEKLFVTQGTSSQNTYTSNLFVKGAVSGGCLVTIGSTGGTGYNFPSKQNDKGETVSGSAFEVGVAEVPQADESNKKIIMQGPSMCFFKRASQEQKKYAWLFYKYLTNTDNSASYSFLTGYQPVRTSSFSSPYYDEFKEGQDEGTKYELIHKVTQFLPQVKDDYFTSPAFEGSTAARDQMEGLLAAVCNNGTSVDKAFEDAETNCVFATNN